MGSGFCSEDRSDAGKCVSPPVGMINASINEKNWNTLEFINKFCALKNPLVIWITVDKMDAAEEINLSILLNCFMPASTFFNRIIHAECPKTAVCGLISKGSFGQKIYEFCHSPSRATAL